MKIITWNCNGAFWKKFEFLEALNPDILIIQECEDPATSSVLKYQHWAQNYLWVGTNKHKGMGVFCTKKIALQNLGWKADALELFLPVRVDNQVDILAVWTKQTTPASASYIGQLGKYLQLHKQNINTRNQIICGDFNSNPIWDKRDKRWNHSNVARELEQKELCSVYHEVMAELPGKETTPTFYMYRNLEKPYHIDYIFSSRDLMDSLQMFEIGRPEEWLVHSDHMPVVFSFGAGL